MAISAKDVKKLRDMTGAGMMDCKKALVETDGNIDAAVEFLQVKGKAGAEKKAGRVAAEGLVDFWISDDASQGVLVEVNCETDFVSRNNGFISMVSTVTKAIGESGIKSIEESDSVTVDGKPLGEFVTEQISKIGENVKVRRVARFDLDGTVGPYIHKGGQIGVLVATKGTGEAAATFARDIAMHAAAMRPGYLSPDSVDEEAAAKQAELFRAQLAESGKPEKIIPKIMEGKMRKWRNESSLLEQAFVKNSDLTVRQHQEAVGGVELVDFVRFEVGEGIEKEETDLAAEVAEALKG